MYQRYKRSPCSYDKATEHIEALQNEIEENKPKVIFDFRSIKTKKNKQII